MRLLPPVLAVALVTSACSFALVRGPSRRVGLLPDDPAKLRCTDSTLFPSLDALGGAAAIAVAGGGIVLEQTSDDGEPKDFTKLVAGPLVALGIIYFVSASFGNRRITWCTDAKERIEKARDTVRPIELPPSKQRGPDVEIDMENPNQ